MIENDKKEKKADIFFINKDNAKLFGLSEQFINSNIQEKTLAFFKLYNCSDLELNKIIEYKSWYVISFYHKKEKQYFVHQLFINSNNKYKIVYTTAGFSSILIRYLQSSQFKYKFTKESLEQFQSPKIYIPELRIKLWNFQQEAVDTWMKAGYYGIIKSPTASGKTLVGTSILKKVSARTIILVHTNDLVINIWNNYLIKLFGNDIKEHIGIIGGCLSDKNRSKLNICKKDFNENLNKDIVIATYQSLTKHLQEIGKQKFGLMICDEVHRSPSSQFSKVVNELRCSTRLGLSGSLKRPDGLSPMIRGLIGEIVFKINVRDLVKKGLISEPVFYSIIIDDQISQQQIQNSELKLLELARYIKQVSSSSQPKFRFILSLCKSLKIKNSKFMLYTDYINNCTSDNITNNTKTRDIYLYNLRRQGLKVEAVTAEMSSIERDEVYKKLDSDSPEQIDGIVFGALGNEGINLPQVESVIMANATASTLRFPQRSGRAMRTYYDIKKNKKKDHCYIYEILLNTPKELEWSNRNFFEYEREHYKKNVIHVDSNGKTIRK